VDLKSLAIWLARGFPIACNLNDIDEDLISKDVVAYSSKRQRRG
jgi:hypothetical protein